MDYSVSDSGVLKIPEDFLDCLLKATTSSSLEGTLLVLVRISRSEQGRSDLSSRGILPAVLELVESRPSPQQLLLLSLQLLRNLCAGVAANQNLFIEEDGGGVVLSAINAVGFDCDDSGCGIIRAALQVLANVSLAGEKQQRAVWGRFFPDVFLRIARIRRRETCDPLSMIIYVCSDGSVDLFGELCQDPGLAIMAEIVHTASEVGFGEDWLKLLLSRICLEDSHFAGLFTLLSQKDDSKNLGDAASGDVYYTSAQAFFLRITSEILNERLKEIHVSYDFAVYVLGIFQRAIPAVDFDIRGQSSLPTGCVSTDVLGYSLTILKDICALGSSVGFDSKDEHEDVVYTLVSKGLLDVLLSLLRDLELPSSIRRKEDENEGQCSKLPKVCPYKGFRRDIVAVFGNCSYRRKHIQDEVRKKDGLILLLQQCVLDEENPFLREWGIFCARNLLEGNDENQQMVAELEVQGVVHVPELARAGLKVEIDPNTRCPRLVNVT